MKKHLALSPKSALLILTSVLVSACDSITLHPASEIESIASHKSEVMTEDPKKIGLYSYVIFVIDKSGSNVQGNNGGPPTDPNRESGIRARAIKSFFDRNKTNPYVRWGFIVFQDSISGPGVRSYIPEQGGPNKIFTEDPALMEAAINRFKGDADSGGTPYKGAVTLTKDGVKAELKKAQSISGNFNIIFMTDGYPTDYGTPISDATIYADVENLVGLAEHRIFFSTIYYLVESRQSPMSSSTSASTI